MFWYSLYSWSPFTITATDAWNGLVHQGSVGGNMAAAVTLLAKIKAGKLTDVDGVILESFTPREVAKKEWTGLKTSDAVSKAADLLVDYDWLRKELILSRDEKGRGRHSDRYTINPLMKGVMA